MKRLIAALLFVAIAASAVAQEQDAAARAQQLAPMVDEDTIALCMVDTARIEAILLRIEPFVGGLLTAERRNALRHMIAQFRAAGGAQVVVGVSLWDVGPDMLYGLMPLPKEADAEAVGKLLPVRPGLERHWGKGVLVIGAQGLIERIQKDTPKRKAEFTDAMSFGGDAAVRLCIVPTPDVRRALVEMMPTLPREVGGGSIESLAKGLKWLALTVDGEPKLSLNMRIQCTSEASARQMLSVIRDALAFASKDESVLDLLPRLGEFVPLLTPRLDGPALTLTLNEEQIGVVIEKLVAPPARDARAAAERAASMNNIRQIMLAARLYADKHKDEWPPSLQVLLDQEFITTDRILRNPRDPERAIGYVYLKPSKKALQENTGIVVVYEAYDAWPAGGIWAGFADGHAQLMTDEAAFKKLLAAPR
jgi:hypothetical protein